MKRGGGYKPWFNKQNHFQAKRLKPLVLSGNNNDSDDDQNVNSTSTSGQNAQSNQTYVIPPGTKECVGWALYFPREGMITRCAVLYLFD